MVIRKILENHIRVVMEPMENYRSVSIGVWLEAGSADENKENNGVAHVVEHMLFKGTERRSAREIADEMAAIGDNLDAYTSKECTCYYTRTLGEYAYEALDILGDMLQHAKIDGEDLRKELGVVLDEMDMYEDDADELCHELLQKEVWGDHPLGYIISGEKEVVRNFSASTVRRFMEDYYTGDHMLISVAGNFEPDKMLAAIEMIFGTVRPGSKTLSRPDPVYRPVMVCRHKDIEQMHLDLAFDAIPYEHEDKYVLSVVNSILGGNGNSRLFQEVREDKGLAYSIYSYGSSFKNCGLFQIYAAMAPRQTDKVLDAILEAVDRMKRVPVSEHELELTKRQICTELYLGSESTHNRMDVNAKTWIYMEKEESLEQIADKVRQVSAGDIQRFMETYVDFNKISGAFVGNFSDMDADQVNEVLARWKIPQKIHKEDI
ncbi:putative Zn-dependent peptidase [Catenibacillus scindens]|uniref:Putative Zn-dependent peptidase n=1 Tax=Catenibacillus scindens TaxID=673271 RepID=A0A7W8M5I6_9FIRM|nr:pitrilysin family protein [Catenibacillus scindens]MBB5265268.1 putative Zn-dependent peptidase [Catenibacillus scindens]